MLLWLHENEHGHETGLQKADVDATTVELHLSTSSIRQKPREDVSRPKKKNAESRVLHGETQTGCLDGKGPAQLLSRVLQTPACH